MMEFPFVKQQTNWTGFVWTQIEATYFSNNCSFPIFLEAAALSPRMIDVLLIDTSQFQIENGRIASSLAFVSYWNCSTV